VYFILNLFVFLCDEYTASSARLYRKLKGAEFVTAGFDHVEVVTPGYGHAFYVS
jgi:hypothetical protein